MIDWLALYVEDLFYMGFIKENCWQNAVFVVVLIWIIHIDTREDLRRWFIAQEIELFRFRFQPMFKEAIQAFLKLHNLHYTPVSWTFFTECFETWTLISVPNYLIDLHFLRKLFQISSEDKVRMINELKNSQYGVTENGVDNSEYYKVHFGIVLSKH